MSDPMQPKIYNIVEFKPADEGGYRHYHEHAIAAFSSEGAEAQLCRHKHEINMQDVYISTDTAVEQARSPNFLWRVNCTETSRHAMSPDSYARWLKACVGPNKLYRKLEK